MPFSDNDEETIFGHQNLAIWNNTHFIHPKTLRVAWLCLSIFLKDCSKMTTMSVLFVSTITCVHPVLAQKPVWRATQLSTSSCMLFGSLANFQQFIVWLPGNSWTTLVLSNPPDRYTRKAKTLWSVHSISFVLHWISSRIVAGIENHIQLNWKRLSRPVFMPFMATFLVFQQNNFITLSVFE